MGEKDTRRLTGADANQWWPVVCLTGLFADLVLAGSWPITAEPYPANSAIHPVFGRHRHADRLCVVLLPVELPHRHVGRHDQSGDSGVFVGVGIFCQPGADDHENRGGDRVDIVGVGLTYLGGWATKSLSQLEFDNAFLTTISLFGVKGYLFNSVKDWM